MEAWASCLFQSLWTQKLSWLNEVKKKKNVLQHDDLWFDVKMHCAKSYRPFDLFVNENCKLQNEAKMNAAFERGSARDPRRSPLSAELNDASR